MPASSWKGFLAFGRLEHLFQLLLVMEHVEGIQLFHAVEFSFDQISEVIGLLRHS